MMESLQTQMDVLKNKEAFTKIRNVMGCTNKDVMAYGFSRWVIYTEVKIGLHYSTTVAANPETQILLHQHRILSMQLAGAAELSDVLVAVLDISKRLADATH